MYKDELIHYLKTFVTERRYELVSNVLEERTRYITVVLEDIYQSQNASAVLRSCECLGIQDVHVIENSNEYNINPDVTMGSNKWLDIHKYNEQENNSLHAINYLREKGYRIVATSPSTNDIKLPDFDLNKGKAAFFFGTELTGLSDVVLDNADEFVTVPMYGFTESFNISVCAALVMSHLINSLRKSKIDWRLPGEELKDIKIDWLKKSIKSGDDIVDRFLKENI
jgi:tRNA (guanosine-2'-O-)-methyltransferase